MSIKALSTVSFAKSTYAAQNKVSGKNQTVSQNTNSFELPKYNSSTVSFGMARIDVEKLKERKELVQKYFVKDDDGNLPFAYMSCNELKDAVDELSANDHGLSAKLFLTKVNEKDGLIAHSPKEGVLLLMNKSLNKLPNGEKYLKQIYLTPNSLGKLPAHNIRRLADLSSMAESLGHDTLTEIFTTEDKNQYIPSDFYMKDGLNAYVMELFATDRDTLDKIVFHENEDGEYPPLNGAVDLEAFCRLYKDEPEKLRQYFIRKGNNGDEYINEFLTMVEDEKEFLEALDKQLFDSHPEILKDLYTLGTDSGGEKFADLIRIKRYDKEDKDILPERLMKLITDSDLSEEDSLKILKANRKVLEDVEDIDLIEDYLKDKVEEKRK